MSTKIESRPVPQIPSVPKVERRITPIKWWATIGGLCIVGQVYVYSRWILSGNATPTPDGRDAIPGWMVGAAHFHEVLSVVLLALCMYFFVYKAIRRDGQIGLYGMLCFALLSTYWLDISSNFFNHVYTYNTAFLNLGSWYNFIPLWSSPNGNRIAEPIIFMGAAYVWVLAVPTIWFATVMRRAKQRWPHLGTPGIIGIGLLAAAVFDLLLEPMWVRLGLYSFAGTIPSMTLWQGKYYQFPLYELLIAAIMYIGFALVLWFRDDKGYSFVERGADDLRVTGKTKTLVRQLAVIAWMNVIVLGFGIVTAMISMYPTFSWNKDVAEHRSYLRDGLCGDGTTYACPGEHIPVPRRSGLHVNPDGKLVDADGKLAP